MRLAAPLVREVVVEVRVVVATLTVYPTLTPAAKSRRDDAVTPVTTTLELLTKPNREATAVAKFD